MDLRQKLNIAGIAFLATFVGAGIISDDLNLIAVGVFVPFIFFIVVLPILHTTALKRLPPTKTSGAELVLERWLQPVMKLCAGLMLVGLIGAIVDLSVSGTFSDAVMVFLYAPAIVASICLAFVFVFSTPNRYAKYRWWLAGAIVLGGFAVLLFPSSESTWYDRAKVAIGMNATNLLFVRPYSEQLRRVVVAISIFLLSFTAILCVGIALGW